jgi:hypothetical protein
MATHRRQRRRMTPGKREPTTHREVDSFTTPEPIPEVIDIEDQVRLKVGARLRELRPPTKRRFFQTSEGLELILSVGVVVTAS